MGDFQTAFKCYFYLNAASFRLKILVKCDFKMVILKPAISVLVLKN